jgi:hypothetical protein
MAAAFAVNRGFLFFSCLAGFVRAQLFVASMCVKNNTITDEQIVGLYVLMKDIEGIRLRAQMIHDI